MKWWVSCGCETWSVTAGKEHTLRVFLFTQGFPRGVSLHVCKEEECRITVQTQHCVSVFVFPYIGRSWGCVSEMCGAERGEVTQNWWKQSRGELHRILFWWSSQGRWGGWGIWHFFWENTNVCRVLVGKSDGRRPLGKPRCRWEGNINHLTPNVHYIGRTAQLTSRCCILYIYSTNIRTEYFKHAA